MALTRPTLLSVPAFDATSEQIFSFVVTNTGSQVVSNQLIIRNQDNNDIVYQEKQETFKYEHIVNANELTNNTYYSATISVFDSDGNESPSSIPIQFWCYSSPSLTFTNLPNNNIIQNASFNFQFEYEQNEGETLNTYTVNLYDAAKNLISSSGTLYATNGTPPFNGSYLFTGLENATTYYIEVNGVTINNTIVTTGQISITVQYLRPDLFTLVELKNNCEEGYISIRSNIVLIEGTSNPDPPIYINDKEVDLTTPGSWVEWNSGYSIIGDFLLRLWFRNPTLNSQLLQFSNINGQTITIYYREGYENIESQEQQSYIDVYVQSLENINYYIFSNYINILNDDQYYNFWLTRQNYIYQAQLASVDT